MRRFKAPWNAPEEALPGEGERVLVCREKEPGEKIVEQAWLTGKGWWKVYGTNCKRILAWRPMPEPAEEWTADEPEAEAEPEAPAEDIRKARKWGGFLLIRCGYCEIETAVCIRDPITEFRCRYCARKTPLGDRLNGADVRCHRCGKRFFYHTNVDEETSVSCVNCGTEIRLAPDCRGVLRTVGE